MRKHHRGIVLAFVCGLALGGIAVRTTTRMSSQLPGIASADSAEVALATTVQEVHIVKAQFPDALHQLSEQWKVSIELDGPLPPRSTPVDQARYPKLADSLSRISIYATDVCLADVLQWILRSDRRSLGYSVRNGVIHVGPSADRFIRAYDIPDLLMRKSSPALAAGPFSRASATWVSRSFMQTLVSPSETDLEVLAAMSGSSASGVYIVGKSLVVNTTWVGHRQVAKLLDRLRHRQPIPSVAEAESHIQIWDSDANEWVNPEPAGLSEAPAFLPETTSHLGIFTRVYHLDSWVNRFRPQLVDNAKTYVLPANPVERLVDYLQMSVDRDGWTSGDAKLFTVNGDLVVMDDWKNLEALERTLSGLRAVTEAQAVTKPEGR